MVRAMFIARQVDAKLIPAEDARNIKRSITRSITRQRHDKQALSTIQATFSVGAVPESHNQAGSQWKNENENLRSTKEYN
jgi:hypothetical protein